MTANGYLRSREEMERSRQVAWQVTRQLGYRPWNVGADMSLRWNRLFITAGAAALVLALMATYAVYVELPASMHPGSVLSAPRAHCRQVWTCAGTSRNGCVIAHDFFDAVQPDGGFIHLDGYNAYFIGPDGKDRTPQEIKDGLLYFASCILPCPDGGLIAQTWEGIVRVNQDGEHAWTLNWYHDNHEADGVEGVNWLVPAAEGLIWAIEDTQRRMFSTDGKVHETVIEARSNSQRLVDSMLQDGEVYLLVGEYTDPVTQLSLEKLGGKLMWAQDYGSHRIEKAILLPDASALVGIDEHGIHKVRADGSEEWFKQKAWPDFDGESFVLLADGTIAVWWGKEVQFWKQDGSEARPPVYVGQCGWGPGRTHKDFLLAGDGNIYLNLNMRPWSVCAISPQGKALWRIPSRRNGFKLLEAQPDGRLLGLRLGKTLFSNGFSRKFECEAICLELKR